jgi:hypothetical protein
MRELESASTRTFFALSLLLVSRRTWLQVLLPLSGIIKGVFGI